jgi:alanine dehydrogenase
MLLIHNEVVAKLLAMRECIDAQEHAFRQIPTGGAIYRPRMDMRTLRT